jgi:hypothetical protein
VPEDKVKKLDAPEQIREGIRRLAAAVKSHLTGTRLSSELTLGV